MRTAVELIAGGLRGVPNAGLTEAKDSVTAAQKSAEGIVGRRAEGPNSEEG